MDDEKSSPRVQFDIHELAGSTGDFGTILPLILAVSAIAGLSLGYILLLFWYLVHHHGILLPAPCSH